MSLLSHYAALEQQLRDTQEQLRRLESDTRLKSELEFKKKLEELMLEYDKHSSQVIELLSPKKLHEKAAGTRRQRKLKIYKNPESGEVIETRGGNHKLLREWKDQYGDERVEQEFLVRVE